MKKIVLFLSLLFVLTFQFESAFSQRFPKPEFENGHQQPPTLTPAPRAAFMQWLDVFVLLASLSVASWLVIKKRSRRGVFWLSVFSLAYFGFYREGCICPVGSVQNIVLGMFHPGYVVPATVVLFFTVPLIFTLFFGRTFCAGVCPLGAMQDLVLYKPVSLKPWLQKTLGLIPYIYLGLAILYAATATDFIICRYDPFVGFFRFDATYSMFFLGGIFMLMSLFIGRPYCRFLCPYGVLLNLTSLVSRKHLTIAPTKCIQCRLCEDSCPFGAIEVPSPLKPAEKRETTVQRFLILTVIIPLLVLAGGFAGSRIHEKLASVHPQVELAQHLLNPEKEVTEEMRVNLDAFKTAGKPTKELFAEVAVIFHDFYVGGWILGGFLGLVFGLSLANLSKFKYQPDYITNKGTCFSCARCVDYCPVKDENPVLQKPQN